MPLTQRTGKKTDANIPLSIPHLAGREWDYVKACLDTGWVSAVGSYVDRFERAIADFLAVDHAVAVINGTSALHISLVLAGVGPGDEVLVPALSFIAPVNAVRYVRANPVFMDCDDCLNMDVRKVAEFCAQECLFDGTDLISRQTKAKVKAIIPVHIFGHPVDMEPLMAVAEKYRLKVIEDSCESLGSFYLAGRYARKPTGTIGDFGCFSFNGNKIITTGGGGVIVTSDKRLADKARYYTTQAKDDPERFLHHEVGYNYRLSNVHAAIGCAQMELLPSFTAAKRSHFELYRDLLADVPGLRLVQEPAYGKSNYWFYTLCVDPQEYGIDARELKRKLSAHQIESRFIWALNHSQRPFENFQNYKIEKAVFYQNRCLNLPCSVNLKEDEIVKVCGFIKEFKR